MTAFVNVHENAGTEEGKPIAKRYGVNGYPTLVVVDAKGDEIDRIVGYLPPDKFMPEVRRILKGEGTLPALRKQVEANPDDLAAALSLAGKEAPASIDAAEKRFTGVAEKAKAKGDRETEGKAWLGLAVGRRESGDAEVALDLFERVVGEFAGTAAASGAIQGAQYLLRDPARSLSFIEKARASAKDDAALRALEGLAFSAHLSLAAKALANLASASEGDPQGLNEAAWTAFVHGLAGPAAVEWARKAVEGSKRAPEILDTLANLLVARNQFDEAISLEEEAIGHALGDMKAEFVENVAKWKAQRDARAKAKQAAREGVPAPLEPPGEKAEPVVPDEPKIDEPKVDEPKPVDPK